jgi:tetratricopeptide (TPR) repeat protein
VGAYQVLLIAGIAVMCAAAALGWRVSQMKHSSRYGEGPGFHLAWLAIFLGLAYLSILARRNMVLFALGALPCMAAGLAVVASRMKGATRNGLASLGLASAPLLLAGSAGLVAAVTTNTYYHWNGTTREFGLGVLEGRFPVRAAAFAREAGLPARLYNDLTSGGYLTWDAPVQGGVFIDGRLEVYDTRFFSEYVTALSNPVAWKQQAERYGINTVFLFHRWSNRHHLIRFLVRDPAWKLVYHDEVAILFVRAHGKEGILAKAREIYPRWRERTSVALQEPTPGWQRPLGRVAALDSYAPLLIMIGQRDSAIEIYEQLLEFRLPPHTERPARIQIGLYLAERGVWGAALEHLERAVLLDPSDPRVKQLIREVRDRRSSQ